MYGRCYCQFFNLVFVMGSCVLSSLDWLYRYWYDDVHVLVYCYVFSCVYVCVSVRFLVVCIVMSCLHLCNP